MENSFSIGLLRSRLLLCLAALGLVFVGCAGGGTGGTGVKSISGKVVDDQALPIAGALVEIVDIQEGKAVIDEPVLVVGTDVTDANGEFAVYLKSADEGDAAVVTVSNQQGNQRRSLAAVFDRVVADGENQRVTIAVGQEEAVIVSEEITPIESSSGSPAEQREPERQSEPAAEPESEAEPELEAEPVRESTPGTPVEPPEVSPPPPAETVDPEPLPDPPTPPPGPISVPVEETNGPQPVPGTPVLETDPPAPDPDPDPESEGPTPIEGNPSEPPGRGVTP